MCKASLNVRVDRGLVDRLDAIARRAGLGPFQTSRSAVARKALEAGTEQLEALVAALEAPEPESQLEATEPESPPEAPAAEPPVAP